MSKASIKTYIANLNCGKNEADAARVYQFIQEYTRTNKNEIIQVLKMPHQTVTARLSDLLDRGVITIEGEDDSNTSPLSRFVIVTDISKVEYYAHKRLLSKFENWKKQGLSRFSELLTEEMKQELITKTK
tara:strand:- start:7 stop:396 length:390 start_codon:yes stop_codon:yes gene_type:complete